MGIEELIDEKINDWDDCLNRHYAGETQNSDVLIRAALSDMEQLKSSLPTTEITELQAWKKIAEVTDTDEPTFNPADFYHDMRILFKNAKFDVPVRGDKTLYDNGYRIVHKSSLPTQQDEVVVPMCENCHQFYEIEEKEYEDQIFHYCGECVKEESQ